jgi:protein-export membrane protein SecF
MNDNNVKTKEKIGQDFDFVKRAKTFAMISAAIILVGIIFNVIFGTNLDIQFRGGTLISYTYTGDINKEEAADKISEALGESVNVDTSEDRETGNKKITIALAAIKSLSSEEQQSISDCLNENYADNTIVLLESNSVDPTMGQEFFVKCLFAALIALLLIIIYVAIRFRKIGGWTAGVMAIVALIIDILMSYFTFIIFKLPVDDSFIAVILTILGYSMNDTIIVYDRVRENRKIMGPKEPLRNVVNKSINQSFTRAINTAIATFLAVGTVAIFAIVNNIDSIVTFALPMMIGVISGVYTSVFITGPVWALWREKMDKNRIAKGKKVKSKI